MTDRSKPGSVFIAVQSPARGATFSLTVNFANLTRFADAINCRCINFGS
jgi:hypothetical protein